MGLERRDLAALAGFAAVSLTLRLLLRIDYDEDIDALRFALGVARFDVAELRPHAPYYPVFIAAAKGVALFGASPRAALGAVSAAAGAATVGFSALLASCTGGRRAAAYAALLAFASPFLWLSSEKLLSDMAGTAVMTAALWLCARARVEAWGVGSAAGALDPRAGELDPRAGELDPRAGELDPRAGELDPRAGELDPRAEVLDPCAGQDAASRARTAALVLLGVGLGVRLSYFPIAFACLAVIARTEGGRRAWIARARDLATGVLVWLVPLVLVASPHALVATTWIQGLGHFTRWGGTALTVSSPLDRLHGVAWGIWANGLGGAWLDAPPARWLAAPLLLVLLGLGVRAAMRAGAGRRAPHGDPQPQASSPAQPELWASAIGYFAWALLGQNTAYKPRHWLPLIPLLIVAMANGAASLGAIRRAAPGQRALGLVATPIVLSLAAQWLVDAIALSRQHQRPSPAAALVAFVHDQRGDARPVITRDLGRMLREGAPSRRALDAASDADVVRAVEQSSDRGALITSEALSEDARATIEARGFTLSVCFAAPRSRYVDSLWNELALLEARRAPPHAHISHSY